MGGVGRETRLTLSVLALASSYDPPANPVEARERARSLMEIRICEGAQGKRPRRACQPSPSKADFAASLFHAALSSNFGLPERLPHAF